MIKNKTYKNVMIVINKIQRKVYEFDEDTKELNILEESCGNLTIEDIRNRE